MYSIRGAYFHGGGLISGGCLFSEVYGIVNCQVCLQDEFLCDIFV